MPLLLFFLAMAVAPVADAALRGRPRAAGFADGFVQVVVGGILLVHVLPAGLAAAGWPALLALGGGAMVGVLAHRVPGGERSAGALAVIALLLHALIDGAALAAPDGDGHAGEGMLAWAVILHTLPVGLATWRISYQRAGRAFATGLLVATAAATAVGWAAADPLLHDASPAGLGLAQCAVAGALLHVLGHVGEGLPRRPAGWGGLLGVGVVLLLTAGHPLPPSHAGELGAAEAFVTLLLHSAPALLLGYLVAGALRAFAPAPAWLREGGGDGVLGRLGAAARGALLGLPMPVRSCGALPVYRGLLVRGVATAAAFAFLVAGPEIGFGTVFVSVPLLGGALTGLRVAAAFLVAVGVGVLAAPGRAGGDASGGGAGSVGSAGSVGNLGAGGMTFVRAHPGAPAGRGVIFNRAKPAKAAAPARPRPLATRLREALTLGLVDTADHTAPWVLVGLGIAALVEPLVAANALAAVPAPLAVLAAAIAGMPAYVCAVGATPLVAVLLHKGLTAGAAITFLVTGSAINVATFGALRRLHGTRVAVRYGATVAAAAVAVGLAVDVLFPHVAAPSLHVAATHAHGAVEWASAAVVLLLFASALVRNGAAGFLEPLLHAHAPDGGGHGHDHGGHRHGHGHGHGGHRHGPGPDGHGHAGHGHDDHDHDDHDHVTPAPRRA